MDSLADLAQSIHFNSGSADYLSKVNKVSQLLNIYMHILTTGKHISEKNDPSVKIHHDFKEE
jgi:hypothetical protein